MADTRDQVAMADDVGAVLVIITQALLQAGMSRHAETMITTRSFSTHQNAVQLSYNITHH